MCPFLLPPPTRFGDGRRQRGEEAAMEEVGKNAKEALELSFQISNVLDTGLDCHTLSLLISLVDRGINPEPLHPRRHSDLLFTSGEVRIVDPESIPTYKMPASAVYKCMNPPSCT